jgi:hypothetical protein
MDDGTGGPQELGPLVVIHELVCNVMQVTQSTMVLSMTRTSPNNTQVQSTVGSFCSDLPGSAQIQRLLASDC